jgi:hypothetical protein
VENLLNVGAEAGALQAQTRENGLCKGWAYQLYNFANNPCIEH